MHRGGAGNGYAADARHAINIAGLIQATSHWLLTARPYKHQERDFLLYRFNRFQACRYGLEGILTDVHTGEHKTVAEDIAWLLEQVAPSAEKLGATSAIKEIAPAVKAGQERGAAHAGLYRRWRLADFSGAEAL